MNGLSQLTAVQDALRRRRPDAIEKLSQRFPDLGLSVTARRPLGPGDSAQAPGIRELADIAYEEARADLSETLQVLTRKSKRLAILRLVAGIASAIASASVVALILGQQRGQLLAAGVTFLSSLVILSITYMEDFSGGEGSTRRLREAMTVQTRKLAEAAAQLRIAKVLADDSGVMPALTTLNEVFAEVQVARAQLGLPI